MSRWSTQLKLGGTCRCRSGRSRCLAIIDRRRGSGNVQPQNALPLFNHPAGRGGDVLL
jgi:hypothetical protein